jgi:hypothetical protein
LAVETLNLDRALRDLVNQAYSLTPAKIELMWQTAPPPDTHPAARDMIGSSVLGCQFGTLTPGADSTASNRPSPS